MHFWYLRDLERLDREQTVIAELANSAGWLVSSNWLFDGAALALDAVIRAHGHDYTIRLSNGQRREKKRQRNKEADQQSQSTGHYTN